MQDLPENCPVRDILAQTKAVLALLDKIMEHCEKCLGKKVEAKVKEQDAKDKV